MEGLTDKEISDYVAVLRRRGNPWRTLRPELPWKTLSGFTNRDLFCCALAGVWPMFPRTGDPLRLLKVLDWTAPVIFMPTLTRVISCDELALY